MRDARLSEGRHRFTCGRLPFMRLVRSTLLDRGVQPMRIRYEVFGPDLRAAQTAPESGA
jgi:nitric oxide dioxygenase